MCLLPKESSIAKFVQTIKSNSSKWFSQNHFNKFAWQQGYAAFSVSKSNKAEVETYIKNQEKHHKRVTCEDEFKQYVEKHGFVYDNK